MSEEEGVHWAKRSLDLAFEAGVDCCTIIPVRPGNGAMDLLMKNGKFEKPRTWFTGRGAELWYIPGCRPGICRHLGS